MYQIKNFQTSADLSKDYYSFFNITRNFDGLKANFSYLINRPFQISTDKDFFNLQDGPPHLLRRFRFSLQPTLADTLWPVPYLKYFVAHGQPCHLVNLLIFINSVTRLGNEILYAPRSSIDLCTSFAVCKMITKSLALLVFVSFYPNFIAFVANFCKSSSSKQSSVVRASPPAVELCCSLHLPWIIIVCFFLDRMSYDGLARFLLSEDNLILKKDYLAIEHDLCHPLTHYFINSSHNTYLIGKSCCVFFNPWLKLV